MVTMVASWAQNSLRSFFPVGPTISRWSPSRTYQPPSGSLADVPARAEGPRLKSGTTVASRPAEPSKVPSSALEHAMSEASIRSFTTDSRRARRNATSASVSSTANASRTSWSMTRFFTWREGSMTPTIRWNK